MSRGVAMQGLLKVPLRASASAKDGSTSARLTGSFAPSFIDGDFDIEEALHGRQEDGKMQLFEWSRLRCE
jgi:hypothetical protein